MANFDSEFIGLVFPGFQATPKIDAQNSPPELSAFLSNFTFFNTKFIHGDYLAYGGDQYLRGVPESLWQAGAFSRLDEHSVAVMYTSSKQGKGMLLQKYPNTNGGRTAKSCSQGPV